MFGECHAHVIMDGMNYKAAVALHKNGVCQEAVRTHLEAYQKAGITFVRDGIVVSGYMQDNIMDQHIDDEIVRSVHGANKSSGIKSVIVYKVTGTKEEVIYLDTTYHQFASPDTHSFFDVYYDINQTEDAVDYYLIITRDFAGNQTKKKLTSQRTLLTMFRTSIDRGAY